MATPVHSPLLAEVRDIVSPPAIPNANPFAHTVPPTAIALDGTQIAAFEKLIALQLWMRTQAHHMGDAPRLEQAKIATYEQLKAALEFIDLIEKTEKDTPGFVAGINIGNSHHHLDQATINAMLNPLVADVAKHLANTPNRDQRVGDELAKIKKTNLKEFADSLRSDLTNYIEANGYAAFNIPSVALPAGSEESAINALYEKVKVHPMYQRAATYTGKKLKSGYNYTAGKVGSGWAATTGYFASTPAVATPGAGAGTVAINSLTALLTKARAAIDPTQDLAPLQNQPNVIHQAQRASFHDIRALSVWLSNRNNNIHSDFNKSVLTTAVSYKTLKGALNLVELILKQDTDAVSQYISSTTPGAPDTQDQDTVRALFGFKADGTPDSIPNNAANLKEFAKTLRDNINIYIATNGLSEFNLGYVEATKTDEDAEIRARLAWINPPLTIGERAAYFFGGILAAPFYGPYKMAEAFITSWVGGARDRPYGKRWAEHYNRVDTAHGNRTSNDNPWLTFWNIVPGRIFEPFFDGILALVFEPLRLMSGYDSMQPQNKHTFDLVEKIAFNFLMLISGATIILAAARTISDTVANLWNIVFTRYESKNTDPTDDLRINASPYGMRIFKAFPRLQTNPFLRGVGLVLSLLFLPVDLTVGLIFNTLRGLGTAGPILDTLENGTHIVASVAWTVFLGVITSAVFTGIGALIAFGASGGITANFLIGMNWVLGPVLGWVTPILSGFVPAITSFASNVIAPAAVAVGEGIATAATATWGFISGLTWVGFKDAMVVAGDYLIKTMPGRIMISAGGAAVLGGLGYAALKGDAQAPANNPADLAKNRAKNYETAFDKSAVKEGAGLWSQFRSIFKAAVPAAAPVTNTPPALPTTPSTATVTAPAASSSATGNKLTFMQKITGSTPSSAPTSTTAAPAPTVKPPASSSSSNNSGGPPVTPTPAGSKQTFN